MSPFRQCKTFDGVEYWIKIDESMVSYIKPIYWISNFGRIYSEYIESDMVTSIDHNGYQVIGLSLTTKKKRLVKIHRLVALAFVPDFQRRNKECLQVNHKDGNKLNNCAYNLEWVTGSENVIHALDNGLRNNYGERAPKAVFDNETVIKIADLLVQNKSYSDIICYLGLNNDEETLHRIKRIRYGETWNRLLSNYDFSNYDSNKDSMVFSTDDIIKICKYLERNGLTSSTSEILNQIGIDFSNCSPSDKNKYSKALCLLKKRKKYTKYTKDYNF